MPTTIRALCNFANERKLAHVGGEISRGETATVADEYARELIQLGRAEEATENPSEAETDTAGEGETESAEADQSSEEGLLSSFTGGTKSDDADWTVGEHAGGGSYYALYDGERVENEETTSGLDTVGRGKDAAQSEIDRRNEEGLTPADIPEA